MFPDHSQNLNEARDGTILGSKFWSGRAWWHKQQGAKREMRCEWHFGRRARHCAAEISFGEGDGDDGIQLSLGIPYLFGFYFGVDGIKRYAKSFDLGVRIHDGAIWLHTFSYSDEWNRSDPWWRQGLTWHFPWDLKWYSTEILYFDGAKIASVECKQVSGKMRDWQTEHAERKAAEQRVSETHDYQYTLKSGEVQHRKATIVPERMTWRARWFPLLPITRTRTSIHVEFDKEVGEETGSWKGGVTGCGTDLLPNETPLQALRRMERDRKF